MVGGQGGSVLPIRVTRSNWQNRGVVGGQGGSVLPIRALVCSNWQNRLNREWLVGTGQGGSVLPIRVLALALELAEPRVVGGQGGSVLPIRALAPALKLAEPRWGESSDLVTKMKMNHHMILFRAGSIDIKFSKSVYF